MFLCLFRAHAAQWATVVVDEATIFSDVQMTSVIGFIRKGKRVRVGEVAKNRGRLLAIIVNKKIAYIQLDDISTIQNSDQIFNATERIKKKMNEKVDEKKIAIYAGSMLANVDFASTEKNEENYNLLFYNLGVRGYYRKLGEPTGIRAGFEYMYGPKDEETLSWVSFNVDYTWPAVASSGYDLLFFVGGMLVPYAEYEVDSLFAITGNGLGGQVGVDMKFDLPGRWSLNLDGAYFLLKLFEIDLPDNAFYGRTLNPLINGLKTTAAFTYDF